MHHPLDHVLAAVLTVLFPLRAALLGFRRLKRCPPDQLPAMRRRTYRDAIIAQWALVATVLALWIWLDRRWTAIGLDARLTPGLIGVAVGAVLVVALVLRQRAQVMKDDQMLEHLRDRVRHLEVMMPHARDEFPGFGRLAITAGVCEEVLYRGYLLWYFSAWMDVLPAAAICVVIFGVGHAYQGVKGTLQTGLFGAFLMAVYLITGSIYLSMALHALMDLHSGHLMLRAYEREAERLRDKIEQETWLSEGGAPTAPGSPRAPEPQTAPGPAGISPGPAAPE